MSLYATEVPPQSRLIRFRVGAGPEYDRMIVVTEEDGGKTLFLQGWIGKPLTPAEWRQAKAELYPDARQVRFERWSHRKGGLREAILPLSA